MALRVEKVTLSSEKADGIYDPATAVPELFLDTLRCEIKREYAEVATNPTKGFHFHTGRTLAQLLGYTDEMLEGKNSATFGTLGINFRARKAAGVAS